MDAVGAIGGALLDAVQSDMPAAPVTINGLFVPEDEDNYFGYLGHVSGGDVEYFAFGQNPGATQVSPSSFEALVGLWSTAHIEKKMATAIVENDEYNTVAFEYKFLFTEQLVQGD